MAAAMVDISGIYHSADYIPAHNKAFAPDGELDAGEFISAIDELRARDQWVGWKLVMKPGADKPTKPPVNPHNGRGASHSDSSTWGTYRQAEMSVRRYGLAGVGFVLSEDDDYTGVDLDHCRDARTGEIESWAHDIIALAETYCEISPSGTGVRMFARGKVEKTIKCDPAHVEIYRSQRYLTITGDHIEGTPADIREAPKTLAALIARVATMRPKQEEPVAQAKHNGQFNRSVNAKTSGSTRSASPSNFFRNVNDKAFANIESWVTALFPRARRQPGTGGWRVSSRDLGRRLQEDLSITSIGAVDFGVADMGDPNLGKRTAIDLVIEYGGAPDALEAARWLCEQMGVTPESLGWEDDSEAIEIGNKIVEGLIARSNERARIVVEGVTIDAETGGVIENAQISA